ncbi:MAG: hypothetical protein JJU33_08735 [Phycisphaerales bacterium]|nr:hypothetical protein [Phycisphaerales bacterium]
MNKVLAVAATTSLLCSAGMANILWDNGSIVTHVGAGAGGNDVSMAGTDVTSAGANARQQTTGNHFRIADDFVVSGTWLIESITVQGYETNSATPTWTGASLNVWDGSPADAGSSIVASFSNPTVTDAGVYRVFNGAANLSNTARPVHNITFGLNDLQLGSGTYWIDWNVEGGASGWAPPVMEANPGDPNAPTTPFGNALQLAADGWQLKSRDPEGTETPFIVRGVPAPGAAATFALAGLIGLRRRR